MSAQQNNQKHSINSLVVVDELFAGVWPFLGGLRVKMVDFNDRLHKIYKHWWN